MPGITHRSSRKPLVKPAFLSHGTLEITDVAASRRFYEEVLGLEVVQPMEAGLYIRLGGDHTYVCVEAKPDRPDMPLLCHNGLDVGSEAEVDEAHRAIESVAAEYGVRRLTRPARQHGAYSFYLLDLDGNWWEIGHLPPGGYRFRFEDPANDLTGREGLSADEIRHVFQNPTISSGD
ncbi:VOC family protein [Streptomyces sp. DSM 44917]|uniref:VOC family protein n=1 Tax=Streptomyces boetiae TaxID=3075541 RepID=A0ABU2L7K4_9ACTN|nr:VOC family protein [Streptomyces sp. DSM 44917]MDT0307550.1 VOC family protein [Streptomyces sp. DSM 44917]